MMDMKKDLIIRSVDPFLRGEAVGSVWQSDSHIACSVSTDIGYQRLSTGTLPTQ